MANRYNSKKDRKGKFLEALTATSGVISPACEAVGIGRDTVYRWRKEDPEFAAACKEIEETQIDFVESKLLTKIKSLDTQAIIFYLKTKGRNRGYTEKQEVELSGDAGLTIITRDPETVKALEESEKNGTV